MRDRWPVLPGGLPVEPPDREGRWLHQHVAKHVFGQKRWCDIPARRTDRWNAEGWDVVTVTGSGGEVVAVEAEYRSWAAAVPQLDRGGRCGIPAVDDRAWRREDEVLARLPCLSCARDLLSACQRLAPSQDAAQRYLRSAFELLQSVATSGQWIDRSHIERRLFADESAGRGPAFLGYVQRKNVRSREEDAWVEVPALVLRRRDGVECQLLRARAGAVKIRTLVASRSGRGRRANQPPPPIGIADRPWSTLATMYLLPAAYVGELEAGHA